MADPFYNDNAVPFGSKVVSIGDTSYVLEHISLTRPSHIIERKNEINEPNGWVGVKGFDHGTAVIQIATVEDGYPSRGDTFTVDWTGESETWVVADITQPLAMADYYKANITIRRAINPP